MREQKNIREMNDRELRIYRRALRLRRERRRKVMTVSVTALATFCMIVIFAVSYGKIQSSANTGFKYYTSITVQAGESLWDIADEYMDSDVYENKNSYISEVQSINHLDADGSIVEGQTLVVPYYSAQFVY